MARFVVALADEIPPGGRKTVQAAGRSIGIFNIDGKYFALRDRCPHQGGPLCSGYLWDNVQSSKTWGVHPMPETARCLGAPGTAGSMTSAPDNRGSLQPSKECEATK